MPRRVLVSVFVLAAILVSPQQAGAQGGARAKICKGLAIPDGYVVVAEVSTPECARGAYEISRGEEAVEERPTATRPRRAATAPAAAASGAGRPPELKIGRPASDGYAVGERVAAAAPAAEEVDENEVVRVETTLVTVPVTVLDRGGRFVPGLRKEEFRLFENGAEQKVAFFAPAEQPFTVALLLDTSDSARFRLDDIKEAAKAFARQLRPGDRVMVVTFNSEVMLLTEATSDRAVITGVIENYAERGSATRLYDALHIVVNDFLSKMRGRKAIVLFTDGVDTSSRKADYDGTLDEVSELDALIYPIKYDTLSDVLSMYGVGSPFGNTLPLPDGTTAKVTMNAPVAAIPPSEEFVRGVYAKADRYLHQLAEKTGGRLYRADDRRQLDEAFNNIAEELRRQYSLGYYPSQPSLAPGERRAIKVRVARPDLAVKSRDSYSTAR